MASTAKEKLPGLPDEGQFTLSVNFNALDPGQQELRASRIAQELRTFKVTFVDGGIANFTAYIMEFKVTGKADSKVEASIGMEITGLVTWTDPTALDAEGGGGGLAAPCSCSRCSCSCCSCSCQEGSLTMAMSRDAILAIDDLPRKEVTVEKWHDTVWLRTITAAERGSFMLRARPPADGEEPDYENFRARLLVFCICGEDGRRLFDDDEDHLLGAKCGHAIGFLFAEAQKLNGLAPGAVEDARKN